MNMQNDHSADQKALSILTMALIIGVLLFCLISIVLHYYGGISDSIRDENNTIFMILLVIAVVIISINRAIYTRRIQSLKEGNQSGREKLDIFRGITITHMALCEFTALISIIGFMLLGNFLFFFIVFMALAEMLMKFPTKQRMESVINSGTF